MRIFEPGSVWDTDMQNLKYPMTFVSTFRETLYVYYIDDSIAAFNEHLQQSDSEVFYEFERHVLHPLLCLTSNLLETM